MIEQDVSLLKGNSGLLAALGSGQLQIDLFKKEILVLECIVAGTSFNHLEKIELELTDTARLEVKREKNNEFDPLAVALYLKNVKVGYVPRTKNEVIARLMDAGKPFHAMIAANEWEGNWLRLEVKIYIRD